MPTAESVATTGVGNLVYRSTVSTRRALFLEWDLVSNAFQLAELALVWHALQDRNSAILSVG